MPHRPLTATTVGCLAVLAVLSCAAPALAAPVRPYVAVHGGWGRYELRDINDEVNQFNALIAPFRLHAIENGTTIGGEAGVELPGRRTLGVAYERLSGSSFVGDPSLYILFDVPANVVRLAAVQSLALQGPWSARVGVSAGYVSERGKLRSVANHVGTDTDFRGRSPMGEVFAGLAFSTGRRGEVTLDAGYRRARVHDLTSEGQPVINLTGGRALADYSGFVSRLSLRVRLAR